MLKYLPRDGTIAQKKMQVFPAVIVFVISVFLINCKTKTQSLDVVNAGTAYNPSPIADTSFFSRFADSALSLADDQVIYDPSYTDIPYPNGDVPADKGVCSDVIIRAYRKFGIDLQRLVHEDMSRNFAQYPDKWGRTSADHNIDHRRVPNLMKFFERRNASLPITNRAQDYQPGDIVCWNLRNQITHIGILVKPKSEDNARHLVIHNIGSGQVLADCLFSYKIIGHYRFRPPKR